MGIIGAIATLMLMPNYTMQTRRFDLSGFLLLAVGMAVLTLALDGSKGTGLSPLAITGLVAVGVVALVLYLLHARNNHRALFSLKLFRTRTFSLGLAGSLSRILLHTFTNAWAPWLDSLILTFSVLAQFMLMGRRIENWFVWLAVNTLAVPLYMTRGLNLTAGLYFLFWINAWHGLYQWRKELQTS